MTKKLFTAALAALLAPAAALCAPASFPDIFCRAGTQLSVRLTEVGVLLSYTARDDDDDELINFIHSRFKRLNKTISDAGGLPEACRADGFPALFCAGNATLQTQFTDNGVTLRLEADDDFDGKTIKDIHTAFRGILDQLAVTGGDAGKACRQFGAGAAAAKPGEKFKTPKAPDGDTRQTPTPAERIQEEDSQVKEVIETVDD